MLRCLRHAHEFAEGLGREHGVIMQDCSGAGLSCSFQSVKPCVRLIRKRGNAGRMTQNPLLLWELALHYSAGDLKSLQYLLFTSPHMRLAHWNWTQADQEKTFRKSTQGIVLWSGNARQIPDRALKQVLLHLTYESLHDGAEARVISTSHCPWVPLRAVQAARKTACCHGTQSGWTNFLGYLCDAHPLHWTGF